MENEKKVKELESNKNSHKNIFDLFIEMRRDKTDWKSVEKELVKMIESDKNLFLNIASVKLFPN